MKTVGTMCMFFFVSVALLAQKPKLYNPEANALLDFEKAVSQAEAEKKHVLIQIGGNWCGWCYKFHDFVKENTELDSIVNADYISIKVNYSSKHKNLDLMQKLGMPQRFGFPVFVITDENGVRLHTQNSWYLEAESSYDAKKIKAFLLNWNKTALDPKNNR